MERWSRDTNCRESQAMIQNSIKACVAGVWKGTEREF